MDQSKYEFNAPQSGDLGANFEDDGADSFFNINHEELQQPQTTDQSLLSMSVKQEVLSPNVSAREESEMRRSLSLSNVYVKEETKSPHEQTSVRSSRKSNHERSALGAGNNVENLMVRSRSCSARKPEEVLKLSNHEEILNQALQCLSVSTKKKKPETRKSVFNGIELAPTPLNKKHPMVTRLDKIVKTPKLDLRSRSISRDTTDELSVDLEDILGRRKSLCKRKLDTSLDSTEEDDQNDKSPQNIVSPDVNPAKVAKNLPDQNIETARLPEKTRRSRFSITRFKPITTIKTEDSTPFNFSADTEPRIRKPSELSEFRAHQLRKARKTMYTDKSVAVIGVTGGVQTVKLRGVSHFGVGRRCRDIPHSTKPKPFSFDERDRKMQEQKEQKIKQILEEEKKAALFHANPLPSYLNVKKEVCVPSTRSYALCRKSILQKYEPNDKENPQPFKAQPPVVLHKNPFIPKKPDRPLLEVLDFQLKTEKRAKEREQFENLMKEREAEMKMAMRERELLEKKREEEEVAQLRQEAVHKANPVPKYKPLVIHPSTQPLTRPATPKFVCRVRKQT